MLFHTEGLYGSSAPTVMATDAGLLRRGESVIAVAGTGRGSDTALVMQAASSQHMAKLRVNEMLCKPLNVYFVEQDE